MERTLNLAHPDRHLHYQMMLEDRFRELLNEAVTTGWLIDEAPTAMVKLAVNQVLMIMANQDTEVESARALKKAMTDYQPKKKWPHRAD